MVRTNLFVLLLLVFSIGNAQKSLEQVLNKYNTEEVSYITVQELEKIKQQEDIIILDSREKNEYNVSHLEAAMHVGYDLFSIEYFSEKVPNKDQVIVVYCTLGVRSHDVAFQLKEAGYTKVKNLYGGICEWKNEGNSVVDQKNKPTEKVHTFSKEWSDWLQKGKAVYE